MSSRSIRVLVTGAAGQVGVDLVDTLAGLPVPGADPRWQPDGRPVEVGEFEVVALTHHDLDITNELAVTRSIDMTRPDVVVNLAAYTAVDRAEIEDAICAGVNRDAVEYLARACSNVAAHLITVSTDYVFDGTKGAAYDEGDDTNPLNVYGRTKRDGELVVAPSDTIVRTSWVMGTRGRNIALTVADRASRGQAMRFVTDQIGTATMSADLARAMATLVRERPGGIVHVSNTEPTTWFDIATRVAHRVGAASDLVAPITSDELVPPSAARRPARSDLSHERWRALGWSALPVWSDALDRLVESR